MAKYLVAGGAGFIGSNLVLELLRDPSNKVVVVDNFYTGKLSNLIDAGFLPAPGTRLEVVRGDIIEHRIMDECDTGEPYDYVINLACPASPVAYQSSPIQTMLTNVVGTYNLLCIAVRDNAIFLQSSTSEVYGNPLVHPQPESYLGNVNPYGPRAVYDEGKRAAEALCYEFTKLALNKVRLVRIFNTYGPRMDPNDGRVVSNFINQALKDEPITIYGDGKQTRSFCYVDDMVDALLHVLTVDKSGPINLGNPGEFTMEQLARKVISWTGSMSEIVYKPLPIDDPLQRKPDITLIKSLGWEPQISLDEGLVHTIEWFGGKIV